MSTATHGNIPLNNNGHYVKTALTHSDRERSCHGVTDDQINNGWRERSNNRPVVIQNKPVDTTGCL